MYFFINQRLRDQRTLQEMRCFDWFINTGLYKPVYTRLV